VVAGVVGVWQMSHRCSTVAGLGAGVSSRVSSRQGGRSGASVVGEFSQVAGVLLGPGGLAQAGPGFAGLGCR
jgi:hypothetical protein